MSIMKSAKEFFGLGPMEDEAYYDEHYDTEADYAQPRREPQPRRETTTQPRRSAPEFGYDYQPTVVAVSLVSYNDAQKLGEPFRDGDAVVFEITDASHEMAKRIIDFSAGLCFGLRGKMHNLTRNRDTERRVFAIVPEKANLSTIDLERAAGLR